MGWCAVVGCSNSAEKGFILKRFPKDPKRRREWATRVKRYNWFPTNNSVICEMHFEPQMWEVVREDGSHRLKCDAVPTIFSLPQITSERRPRQTTLSDISGAFTNDTSVPSTSQAVIESSEHACSLQSIDTKLSVSDMTMDVELRSENVNHTVPAVSTEVVEIDQPYFSVTRKMLFLRSSTELSKLQSVKSASSSEDTNSVFLKPSRKQKLDLYAKIVKKNKFLLRKYKNKLRHAYSKIKNLEKKLKMLKENVGSEEADIFHPFGKDQIMAMIKKRKNVSTKFMKWSDQTIIKGLRLKLQCGDSGYAELLKQNLPYPSVRTLQRRLPNLKFDSGILNDIKPLYPAGAWERIVQLLPDSWGHGLH